MLERAVGAGGKWQVALAKQDLRGMIVMLNKWAGRRWVDGVDDA